MAEDLENPEDKVRDNTISVRRSKQFMRTVTAPARSPRRTSHRHRVHRLGGGCAAPRAPATHGRGRLGKRHERERLECLEQKDTVERFWGLILIG